MASHLLQDRPAFPDLLRSWRKMRRLSQCGLAGDAGISQRHLSFLESGRSSPSREMVVRLAETIDLPLRETNALLNAAGFAGIYAQSDLADDTLILAREALTLLLERHEPYSAIVVDRNWNLVMMNEANTRLFSWFVDPETIWTRVGGQRPNMLRVTLHEQGLRPYIQNIDEFSRYFVRQLERSLAANPFDREARELLDEVSDYPGVAEAVATSGPESRPFLPLCLGKDGVELEFFTMVSTFGTPQDVTLQELRIEMFFPTNDQTESFVRGLK